MSEKFNPQQYRDELANDLRETRNDDEEAPVVVNGDAKELLKAEKKMPEYKKSKEEHVLDGGIENVLNLFNTREKCVEYFVEHAENKKAAEEFFEQLFDLEDIGVGFTVSNNSWPLGYDHCFEPEHIFKDKNTHNVEQASHELYRKIINLNKLLCKAFGGDDEGGSNLLCKALDNVYKRFRKDVFHRDFKKGLESRHEVDLAIQKSLNLYNFDSQINTPSRCYVEENKFSKFIDKFKKSVSDYQHEKQAKIAKLEAEIEAKKQKIKALKE